VATILLSLLVSALDGVLLALALGGLAPLLSHSRALALLASWTVAGLVLALLKPVRSQEIIATTRETAWVLLALGLLPFATPPLAALGERFGVWLLPGGAGLRWLGVGAATLGLVIRIAAMTQLGSRFSPLVAVQREHPLETRGLYRRIRHPGYLGSFLAALGSVLAFGSGLGFVPLALFGALLTGRARREEALMEQHFGQAWRDYRKKTGAFLPRI
jgi:protein-S-isoprenylcysteine O-methyltransferase Ste14